DGNDTLALLPTGGGKSICFQVPALCNDGICVVVSPLIALMHDQVDNLKRKGIPAIAVTSAMRKRELDIAFDNCVYGKIKFLYLSPERLQTELARVRISKMNVNLIAVDEAHCISQWGHDFRPDYRMLGDRLPLLRPAPVIALTATATPTVQDDIVTELRLVSTFRSIHGFRRTNIAVEVVERKPSERLAVVKNILADASRRPAIVYAPTRKESEETAKELSKRFHAAAYHAGLTSAVRSEAQSSFLRGKIDVIVATTAFGMGIDKANVRTVIHTALPASIEGYYQEIGRAGRDGLSSRAILLQSFGDTKTHEFFLERDYPEESLLETIHEAIDDEGTTTDTLVRKTRMPRDLFEKALEKLWVHGGALVDFDDVVRRGASDWRRPYEKQRAHKRAQIDKMQRYAETHACRMLALVTHFGDQNDPGTPCGSCDVCAEATCVAQEFRAPIQQEIDAAGHIIEALRERNGRAIGQMHRDLAENTLDRDAFDGVIGALARAGIVRVSQDAFEKEGRSIVFQRVHLRPDMHVTPSDLRIIATPKRKASRKGRERKSGSRDRDVIETTPLTGASLVVDAAIRAWRKEEARFRKLPAFRILTDKTVTGIAAALPRDEASLLRVSGIGPSILEKYGKVLLAIVARSV
ncbi:MAG: RecQ family ATP-dependent DNA helicase, partial [Polyangiaceae bacterium]